MNEFDYEGWVYGIPGQDKEIEITENGTVEIVPDEGYRLNSVEATVNVPTGGGGEEEKDVIFFDYDGTVVAEYTIEEAQELTELPDFPTAPEGYTPYSWGCTLADVNTLTEPMYYCVTYTADNPETKYYITIDDDNRTWSICGKFYVDWGDGTHDDFNAGGWHENAHTYSSNGNYVLSIRNTDSGSEYYLSDSDFESAEFQKCFDVPQVMESGHPTNDYYLIKGITKVEFGNKAILSGNPLKGYVDLESVIIPYNQYFTTIWRNFFRYCANLKFIAIPSNIQSIQGDIIRDCPLLDKIVYPITASLSSNSFSESGITSLVLADIPQSVAKNCSNLNKVIFSGNNMTTVGSSAFSGCISLDEVRLPDSVKTLESSAFKDSGITKIVMNEVTSLNGNAFYGCKRLTNLELPNTLTELKGQDNFTTSGITGSLIIPDGVTEMTGTGNFNSTKINKIVLSKNITTLYSGAINYISTSCAELILPENLTTLNSNAFYMVTLKTLTIPSKVTTIGNQSSCNIFNLIMEPTTPPTLSSSTALGNSMITIKVPYSSDHSILNAYKTATNWSTYASKMVEMEE